MSGRPLPGYFYDPQTNRYYREQPAARSTQAYERITERTRQSQIEQTLETEYRDVSGKWEFDFKSWKFNSTPHQRIASKSTFQDFVIGKYTSHAVCEDPVVIQALNPLYPTGISNTALMNMYNEDADGIQDDAFTCSISWSGPETRIINRPFRRRNIVPTSPIAYRNFVAVLPTDRLLHVARLTEDLDDVSHWNEISTIHDANETVEKFVLSDHGDILAVVSQSRIYMIRLGRDNEACSVERVVLPNNYSRNKVSSIVFPTDSTEDLLVAHHEKIVTLKDGKESTPFILPNGRSVIQMFPNKNGHTLYAETFHGELLMFDWRFPKTSSLLMQLPKILNSHGEKYKVEHEKGLIYGSFGPVGKMGVWDLRKISKSPMAIYSVGKPIEQVFLSSGRPHVIIKPL